MAYVSQRLCFFLLLALVVVVVVLVGHADGDDSCRPRVGHVTRGSCAGWQNVAVCIHRAPAAAIDALAAIIVVVG